MDASEAILGLGRNSALELLKLSELSEDSSNMIGPEFTYLGVFLSALAYKKINELHLNTKVLALNSLKSVHNQAGKFETAIFDMVASASISAYDEAVIAWPSASSRTASAITLCDILAQLLKSSAQIELPLVQKAKLRAKITDLFEILETAHKEIRDLDRSRCESALDKDVSQVKKPIPSSLDEVRAGKTLLMHQFDDGDITVQEYQRSLEALYQKEIAIKVQMTKQICSARNPWNKKFFALVASAFLLGLLIGPWLYTKLFGYNSAEECILNAKHQYAVGACYDLYPSIRK